MSKQHTNTTLKDIEQRLGYTFKNIKRLENAINPQKHPVEHTFLEHLGDVFLEVALRKWGQKRLKPDKEKYFSFVAKAKSNLILALVAENLGIIEYSNRGHSPVAEEDEALVKEHANIVEAILGAIHEDSGMNAVHKVVQRIIPLEKLIDIEIEPLGGRSIKRTPKRALNTWLKKHNIKTIPIYHTSKLGSMYICTLQLGKKVLKSNGERDFHAEDAAATWMLHILEQKRLRKVLFG